jgi:hypothetical protein
MNQSSNPVEIIDIIEIVIKTSAGASRSKKRKKIFPQNYGTSENHLWQKLRCDRRANEGVMVTVPTGSSPKSKVQDFKLLDSEQKFDFRRFRTLYHLDSSYEQDKIYKNSMWTGYMGRHYNVHIRDISKDPESIKWDFRPLRKEVRKSLKLEWPKKIRDRVRSKEAEECSTL